MNRLYLHSTLRTEHYSVSAHTAFREVWTIRKIKKNYIYTYDRNRNAIKREAQMTKFIFTVTSGNFLRKNRVRAFGPSRFIAFRFRSYCKIFLHGKCFHYLFESIKTGLYNANMFIRNIGRTFSRWMTLNAVKKIKQQMKLAPPTIF